MRRPWPRFAARSPLRGPCGQEIDCVEAVMSREDDTRGFFVNFDYSDDAPREINDLLRKTGNFTVAPTVREILEAKMVQWLV